MRLGLTRVIQVYYHMIMIEMLDRQILGLVDNNM